VQKSVIWMTPKVIQKTLKRSNFLVQFTISECLEKLKTGKKSKKKVLLSRRVEIDHRISGITFTSSSFETGKLKTPLTHAVWRIVLRFFKSLGVVHKWHHAYRGEGGVKDIVTTVLKGGVKNISNMWDVLMDNPLTWLVVSKSRNATC
jgi:hypothetical protein